MSKGVLDRMNVTMVGFGNGRVSPTGDISCQHGPNECLALTWEDCAIQHYPKFSDYWPFVLCMETAGENMLKNTKKCATQAGIDYDTLNTCFSGSEGKQVLAAAGKATGNHTYVPWVRVNGAHNADAEQNLLKTICALIDGEKPGGCKNEFEKSEVARCDA